MNQRRMGNSMLARVQRRADAQYNLDCDNYAVKLESSETSKMGTSELSIPVRKITKFFSRG